MIQTPIMLYWRTLAVFVLLSALGGWIVSVDAFNHIESKKQTALQLAGAKTSIISQQLNASISLTYTLETVLRNSQFHIDPARFEEFAKQLMLSQLAVSSLQYAPDGIVTHVAPIQGNESIIGHNLLDDSKRNKEAFAAIDEHKLTVAGPFELIQGGLGIVARLPVFITKEGEEQFWGFSTVLILVDELLKSSGIESLFSEGYDWILWRHHPDSGFPHIFSGTSSEPIDGSTQLTIPVPNATWFLNLKPREGWLTGYQVSMTIEIAILLILSIVGTGFAFLLQKQPLQLQQQVALKTKELQDTNTMLLDSEYRYRSLVENTDDLITRVDKEGRLLYVNSSSTKYWGLSPKECIGMTAFDFIHDQDKKKTKNQFMDCLKSKSDYITFENRQRHRSGRLTNMLWAVTALHDSHGEMVGFTGTARDMTERHTVEMALRESESRFRLLFESNPDPVILSKLEDGSIIDVNNAFCNQSGITQKEAIGRNSLELELWSNNNDRAAFREILQRDGRVDNLESNFKIKNGASRTALVSAQVLKLNDELCILITTRDITTEKNAERSLISMDKIKNEFISTAAHELNTPLSAIMGYTELLQNPGNFGGFSEEQTNDFLNEIYDRCEALNKIISDLLDVSRIESGNPVLLCMNEVDILAMLSRALEVYQLHHRGHIFKLELPEVADGLPIFVDRHRINQVLENLISNAAKYSPKGAEVILKAAVIADNLEVRVIDHGIGMSKEQVKNIFDKFYRADASNTAVGGLGLGMSIAKQIVEEHNGTIWVKSTLGEGTQICFTLPLTQSVRT